MKRWIYAFALTLVAASTARAAAPPTPLFASDPPVRLSIRGPISTLVSERSSPALPATLTAPDGTYPITLEPRGLTRRTTDICDFPPLRITFTQTPPPGSMFAGQRRLKLVTHCKRSADFQQKVLLEYSAYRLYNLLTPVSFRARLANIDYIEDSGRPHVSRVAFFIEDLDDVARRNGMTVARMGPRVPLTQIDPVGGARMAVFEYMISNYDWSMRAGPPGDDCCHNGRLLAGAAAGGLLTPVPYDFDYSGLVGAPYATVPEGVPVSNVRQRSYRGYCAHVPHARAAAAQIAPRRGELLGVFATIPGMDERTRSRAVSFLDGFFSDVASGKMLKACVS